MRKQIERKYRMGTGIFLLFMIIFFTIIFTLKVLHKEKDEFNLLNLNSEHVNYDIKQCFFES